MDDHAKLFYEEIRQRTSDVETIAKNTGFSTDEVATVKNHIFLNTYSLGYDEPTRFDPDYDMAVSWQRLITGTDIQEMDLVMLRHELMEHGLMTSGGLSYRDAHARAEQLYNYSAYITALNRKEGLV